MPVVDTSWLLGLFGRSDVHHVAAIEQAQTVASVDLPAVVLVEFLMVVRHRVRILAGEAPSKAAVRQALQDIEAHPSIRLLKEYDAQAASMIFRRHAKLSYVDAVGVAVAKTSRQPLWTFDAEQRRALERETRA